MRSNRNKRSSEFSERKTTKRTTTASKSRSASKSQSSEKPSRGRSSKKSENETRFKGETGYGNDKYSDKRKTRSKSSHTKDEGSTGTSRKRVSDKTSKSSSRINEERPQKRSKFGATFSSFKDEKDSRERSPRSKSSYVKKKRFSSKEEKAEVETSVPEKIRLNKFIANSGVCSRREADELITMGLITVNGKVVTELGYKVNPGDEVRHEEKVLRAEKPVYILMNKPKGYLTTTRDPQERNTVMQLIGQTIKERVYPVGRLDRNTTGLLLLTNDGDLAERLSHPSYKAKKIYKVELDRPLTKADLQKIADGVVLEEGRAMVDDVAIVSADAKTVGLELHIGWNRVVRRIFEALGYDVVKLDRSVYAGLDKKDLPRGHWRFLRKEEIIRLKHYKN